MLNSDSIITDFANASHAGVMLASVKRRLDRQFTEKEVDVLIDLK